jgi:hypothetical protein
MLMHKVPDMQEFLRGDLQRIMDKCLSAKLKNQLINQLFIPMYEPMFIQCNFSLHDQLLEDVDYE